VSFASTHGRDTGTPRGFAFVEFAKRADAEEAIRRLNQQLFKGRPLAVSEARARDAQAPPRARARGPALTAPGRPEPSRGPDFGPDAAPLRRRSVRRTPSAAEAPQSLSAPSDRCVSSAGDGEGDEEEGAATTGAVPHRRRRGRHGLADDTVRTRGMTHTSEDQDGKKSASDLSKA